MADWLHAPVLKPMTWVQLSTWPSLLSNQHYIESSILIFFDYDKIALNIFCLALGMIREYQVSFSVKTSQKTLIWDVFKHQFFEHQIFELLNIGCQCFLISVDISEENILKRFGGTNPP